MIIQLACVTDLRDRHFQVFLNGIHHLSNTALWPRAELNPHSRAGPFFRRRLRSHTRMDEDLANIIRTALDEAKTAGRDDTGQTEYAVRKVLELRHDMTDTDVRNAINLVRSFL